MTATPTWPLTDEVAAIDQQIDDLQRAADQAKASSAVSATEVAIAQKAIRDLTTAKAEILEKERLWDRTAQLQTALAQRKAVADRVRQALDAGGSLAAKHKSDLETALKVKAGIAPSGKLDAVFNAAEGVDEALKTADETARNKWHSADVALATAKQDYASKAEAAEAAWGAIQNSARSLDELLSSAQKRLAEAGGLTEAVIPAAAHSPVVLNPAAAEAGLAWKDFVDAFEGIKAVTKLPGGDSLDKGEKDLVTAWESARDDARDALAVLLDAQKTAAEKQQIHEQRQAPRPGRTASEREAVLEEVRKALTPAAPPTPPVP
jgi:hypothetical protein